MILTALQAAAMRLPFAIARRLGPVRASDAGGRIARTLGPYLPVSRVADTNLRRALPELDASSRRRIIHQVWDNLGRTFAELPHLARLKPTASGPGWELAGFEHVRNVVEEGAQVIFFSGHLGNWEIMLPLAKHHGVNVAGIYRAPSNPAADKLMSELRKDAGHVPMFAKGATGARLAMKHMAAGGSLGLLADQKMNDGIPVPFFGRPAMTAPALAQLAIRFRCLVIPARIDRLGPARLRMTCEAPLPLPDTGNRHADVLTLMTAVNQTLERWIRADPGNWLWLHRRWPKDG